MTSLARTYDCLLLDLDGTVFRGARPTTGAVQTLVEVRTRKLYVTNNASRSADEVATHLRDLGFTASRDDVVTSAQAAARLLAGLLPADAPVLVVGTEALANEITAVGLRPVRRYDDGPVAVVQGLSTTIGWPDLAEAALAIRSGALWVAANVDPTLPTERGLLPGNGSLVAALRAATGAEPRVAGKPAPQLLTDAVLRGDSRAPLVIGDRLDTDIEGAHAAGLPSLLVLTGVNSAADAVHAPSAHRPTYIAPDLRSLHAEGDLLAVGPQPEWCVGVGAAAITVSSTDVRSPDDGHGVDGRDGGGGGGGGGGGDGLSIVRAVAAAVWSAGPDGSELPIEPADERAREALRRWSLVRDD